MSNNLLTGNSLTGQVYGIKRLTVHTYACKTEVSLHALENLETVVWKIKSTVPRLLFQLSPHI